MKNQITKHAIFLGGNLKNRRSDQEGKIEKNRLGCFQWEL